MLIRVEITENRTYNGPMEATCVITAMSDLRSAAAKHLARNGTGPEAISDLKTLARRYASNLLANDPSLAHHFSPEELESLLLRIVDDTVTMTKSAAA